MLSGLYLAAAAAVAAAAVRQPQEVPPFSTPTAPYVAHCSFSTNYINGTLPPTFSALTTLEVLDGVSGVPEGRTECWASCPVRLHKKPSQGRQSQALNLFLTRLPVSQSNPTFAPSTLHACMPAVSQPAGWRHPCPACQPGPPQDLGPLLEQPAGAHGEQCMTSSAGMANCAAIWTWVGEMG